MKESKHPLMQ